MIGCQRTLPFPMNAIPAVLALWRWPRAFLGRQHCLSWRPDYAGLQDRVWEIRGLLRGSMGAQHFLWEPGSAPRPKGDAKLVKSGSVDVVSPKNGEAMQLSNALAESVSISIHVYGETSQDLRHALDADGTAHAFIPGYANPVASPAYDIWSIQPKFVIDHAALKESKQHLSEKQH